MTYPGAFSALASIDAVRPVFLIVMGICLMMLAWRFSRNSSGWAPRLMMPGALLLGFGYAVLLPLYDAGRIEKFLPLAHSHGNADALAWHAVKIFTMNIGWLLFGLGLAIHAKALTMAAPASRSISSPSPVSHESAA